MAYLIGIDLGGTNIKAAAISQSGEILEQASRPSEGNFAVSIRELISDLQRNQKTPAERIGLAAPGLASRDGRSIAFMPGRLKGLENLDWTEFLKTSAPVCVLNDAHAALLGEIWKGAAQGCRDAFMLTLGTGVGGAIFSDGRLLKGHIGRAGHLGHISLDANGSLDIVGTPGSLEDAIGECTLKARTNGQFGSTRELVEGVAQENVNAREIWTASVHKLAAGVASLINVLDPEVVIIGGGIAQAGPALFEPLETFLAQFEWRPGGHRARIVSAKLGDRAGALGAAYNAILTNPL